jgi:hypothetical protein
MITICHIKISYPVYTQSTSKVVAPDHHLKYRFPGETTNNNEFICTSVITSPINGDDNEFGELT